MEHRIEEFLSDAVYASFGIQNIVADMRPDLSGLQGADHRVAITQRQLGKTPDRYATDSVITEYRGINNDLTFVKFLEKIASLSQSELT